MRRALSLTYLFTLSLFIAQANTSDLKLKSISTPTTLIADTAYNLELEIENLSGDTVRQVILVYSDSQNSYFDTLTGISLAAGASMLVSHSTSFSYTVGQQSLSLAAYPVADLDSTNNTGTLTIDFLKFIPETKVVIEEGTGTWCGWCPRGAVAMEYMSINYPNDFIGIAVHNGDPMADGLYNHGAGITGFPGMNVDRDVMGAGVDTQTMEYYYLSRKDQIRDGEISITSNSVHNYYGSTEVTVEARFAKNLIGDYRIAVVVVEDSVWGRGSSWGQRNYYAGGVNGTLSGAGHDWHLEPDPVQGGYMWYDHVGRQLLGGYDGQEGSIPDTIVAGETYTYTFTDNTQIKTDDFLKVSFVALLLDPQGRIVNAHKTPANVLLSQEEEISSAILYPNPSKGLVNLNLNLLNSNKVELSLFDNLGRIVDQSTLNLSKGKQVISKDFSHLPKGMYFLKINANQHSISKPIILE